MLVFLQQQFPSERNQLHTSWELLQKWESLRLRKSILDAMLCLAISWGWARWDALTMIAFYGACRVSEPLKASRRDLILPGPDEAGLSELICFLNIAAPKPGTRGKGRVQQSSLFLSSKVYLSMSHFTHLQHHLTVGGGTGGCLEVCKQTKLGEPFTITISGSRYPTFGGP